WRPVFPFWRKSKSITIRHLDLRQALGVHDFVFLDDVALVQQEGGQRVHLVGSERPLFSQRHAAIDVIPYRRREGRVNPHGVGIVHTRRETRRHRHGRGRLSAFPAYQCRRMSAGPHRPVASHTPFPNVERGAFFGSPLTCRELLSGRADGDIPVADFLCARGPSEAISGRLCPGSLANPKRRRNEHQPTPAHCERSHRRRFSTVERCCRTLEPGSRRPEACSSISPPRPASVEPCPVRPCSATSAYTLFHPSSSDSRIGYAPLDEPVTAGRHSSSSGRRRWISRHREWRPLP